MDRRLADLERELRRIEAVDHRHHGDSTRRNVQRCRVEYELCRVRLLKAIADADRWCDQLATRLADLDRRAQRRATTISVAHATAS